MLKINHLTKNFKNKVALDQVSFSIGAGEIVGVIGPNGSGKTTLLNILMGMIKPSAGSFSIVGGIKVGMAVSRQGFFEDMTANQNIDLYAQLLEADEDRVLKMKDQFNINFGRTRFGKLSAGMKQRVSLVFPFIRHNDLILLDEPTNHLDIDAILNLRKIMLELKATGVSFLVTSHIFSDLEKTCDRIIFLKEGRVYKDSPVSTLIQEYGALEEAYLNIFQSSQML